MSAAPKARPALPLAALLRELEQRGVTLWLQGDLVRWRGPMTPELLDAARDQRDALAEYLRRCCSACGQSRPVMVEMQAGADGAPWWLCAACWRG